MKNMKKKYTHKYIKGEIEKFGCLLEGKQANSVLIPVDIRCSCGNIWRTNFSCFIRSKHHCCKKCSSQKGANTRIISFEYVKRFFEIRGYHILDNKNFRHDSKMNVVDKKGFKYFVSYTNLKTINKKGRIGLAKFGRNNPHSIHNARIWIVLNNVPLQIEGNAFSVTEKIIETRCNICDYVWMDTWDSIYHGHYCPKCKKSKGESQVMSFLDSNKIEYKYEYFLKYCQNKRCLYFDFYLENKKIAIEYNGKQHYEVVDFFNKNNGFNKQQLHDQIKRNYCKKNNIKLIEIPYWDFDNIELILTKDLKISA